MTSNEQIQLVISCAIRNWRKTFAGTSGLDIATHLSIPHDEVRNILEYICDEGKGSLNRNVELYQVRIDPSQTQRGINGQRTTTHIFFPSKELLHEDFYRSNFAKQSLPEYLRRLHLGANQVDLVFFSEEVLSRYFSHPEFYDINDSLSGGEVSSSSAAPKERYLHQHQHHANGDIPHRWQTRF